MNEHNAIGRARLVPTHHTGETTDDGWVRDRWTDSEGWRGQTGGYHTAKCERNTHHGGAGHSMSVPAGPELSGWETPAPPPR